MKDGTLLLFCGLLMAGISWATWHFLGENAVNVILLLALVSSAVDNMRLRRKLRLKNDW
jgi:hypothetical protein